MKYLQYIQGDSVNNWIDTGVTLDPTLAVELKMSFTPTSGVYYGTVAAGTSDPDFSQMVWFTVLPYGTGTRVQTRTGIAPGSNKNYDDTASLWSVATPNTLKWDIPNRTLYVDGVSKLTNLTRLDDTTTGTYYLCQRLMTSSVGNTTTAACRLYYCKLWKGSTLVRDFVPVLDNGVATLYDKVTDTVFVPGGTIPFTAGPERPFDWTEVTALRIPEGEVIEISSGSTVLWKKPVPYDAEVEYLESTGTQWIDTLCTVTTDTRIEAKWQMTNTSVQQRLFGLNDGSANVFACYINNNGLWAVNTGTSSGGTIGSAVQTGIDYSGTFNLSTGVCTINGTTRSNGGTPFNSANTIPIFARRNTGTVQLTYLAEMRLISFQIYHGSTLVSDFHPVRVGTTGYLFDRISWTLFGNAGTGDFGYGADVPSA